MTRQFQVYVIGGEPDEQVTFTLSEAGKLCRLTCSYRGKVIARDATDYFEALCLIREQLAEDRLIPFCYGASMNVYPLGRIRGESRGLVAYRLTAGRQVTVKDAVEIFAEGPDIIPAPVDMQRDWENDWHASVQARRQPWNAFWDWVLGNPLPRKAHRK